MNSHFIHELWDVVAGRKKISFSRSEEKPSPQLLEQLSRDILSGKGEASGVKLSRQLLDVYEQMTSAERAEFLTYLIENLCPDQEQVHTALLAYQKNQNPQTLIELGKAVEPKRQELFRRLNHAPGGTAALVKMRGDALDLLKNNPDLAAMDYDFTHLFSSWFNRGFLVLSTIDWSTPANILAKIIRYEAVHAIESWDDLRNRLEPSDRRCFAFFHPQMPDEPLVFVEVALTRAIPNAIQPLLDLNRTILPAQEATTAVFYSISNCQNGLKGISFGNFLIKQVVEELKKELPQLRTFVTLSPIPGFTNWLKKELSANNPLLTPQILAELRSFLPRDLKEPPSPHLHKALHGAACVYFLQAKNKENRPVDPVARFHLGNGARLERINLKGDSSLNGLTQSAGVMVNYLYDLETIEANHEAYANYGRLVSSKNFTTL